MADDSLRDFISQFAGDEYLRVEQDLGDGFVRLKTAEAEKRQAKQDIRCVEDIVVEMLRNARDAHADHLFVALSREGGERRIVVIDDGSGIPAHMTELIFEPRVTSKLDTMSFDSWGVHGRGMALFSIRSNAKDAVVFDTGVGKGSSFVVTVDLKSVPEKADQATLPELEEGEDGALRVVRGPHNVLRQTVEFSLESPDVDVYVGSPVEILATLRAVGEELFAPSVLLACHDLRELPLVARPAAASDALELARVGDALGLPVSDRSAHRILSGDVKPLPTVLERASAALKSPLQPQPSIDLMKDRRGLRIAPEDLASFKKALEGAFEELGESYYISLLGSPKVTVSGDSIRVRFDIEKDR